MSFSFSRSLPFRARPRTVSGRNRSRIRSKTYIAIKRKSRNRTCSSRTRSLMREKSPKGTASSTWKKRAAKRPTNWKALGLPNDTLGRRCASQAHWTRKRMFCASSVFRFPPDLSVAQEYPAKGNRDRYSARSRSPVDFGPSIYLR